MRLTQGTLVRMDGPCECEAQENCFHGQCSVNHIFQDGSVWASNGYGFARRIEARQFKALWSSRQGQR